MEKSKYFAQAKHIKENYAQFKINLKQEILDKFKEKCSNNGTTPTTELKRFIDEYIKD